MKIRHVLFVALLLTATYYASQTTPPGSAGGGGAARDSDMIRQMASFLAGDSGRAASGSSSAMRNRRGAGRLGSRGIATAGGVGLPGDLPSDSAVIDDSYQRFSEMERALAGHYVQSKNGNLIRKYVSLSMTATDSDFNPETNKREVLRELLKDPGPAAKDLQLSLNAIQADAEEERGALLKLAEQVGANEQATFIVENILRTEIQRQVGGGGVGGSPGNSEFAERRTAQLIDSYSLLVHDVNKQMRFVRMGLASQDDPRVREMLQGRLDHLARIDPSQIPPPAEAPADPETQAYNP